MITTYFRSSSYNTHDGCPQDYFISYILGWQGLSNLKADKGTICHKVLEILAVAKKGKQDGEKFIEDEIVGRLPVGYFDINEIIEKVYKYYSEAFSHHTWTIKDFQDVKQWCWKAITFNNGQFDPRNQNIVQPELRFDFEIKKDWAKYQFNYKGETISGYLSLKGTIDLIVEVSPGMYEVIDYKTGRRLNWNTGEEKTYKKLCEDPQLMLYYYALYNVLPNVEEIMVTIYYINDGGPFTVSFSKKDIPKIEDMLKRKFEAIKKTTVPRLVKSWKCSKLCSQRFTFEETAIKPIVAKENGHLTKKGQIMSKCEQIHYEIKEKGINRVTEEYTCPGHDASSYRPPGSTE